MSRTIVIGDPKIESGCRRRGMNMEEYCSLMLLRGLITCKGKSGCSLLHDSRVTLAGGRPLPLRLR